MAAYLEIKPGDKHGCLMVVCRTDDSVRSKGRYKVRCDCGHEYQVAKEYLLSNPANCRTCRGEVYSRIMEEKRRQLIGSVINGFRVLESLGRNIGASLFRVECIYCGNQSEKSISNMKVGSPDCCNCCPPNYWFIVKDGIATGYLKDGNVFCIDEEDIPLVSEKHWYVNGGGYMFRREARTRKPERLHRTLLGLSSEDDCVVDHINRNKLDNRRCNLRITTQTYNCYNSSIRKDNSTGYLGVSYSSKTGGYSASAQRNGAVVSFFTGDDIVKAAQMYNIAAMMLFGEFAGELNDVPKPPPDLIKRVENRCKIKMGNQLLVAQTCDYFFTSNSGGVVHG